MAIVELHDILLRGAILLEIPSLCSKGIFHAGAIDQHMDGIANRILA